MRAAIFNEPGSVTASVRPDAVIVEPTDAIGRVVLACVCGSDHRGDSPFEPGPIGIKPGRVLDYEIGVDRGVFTTLLEEVP
jgi:threonine dehydrogenase-like Zn-dependent dehydrogenase